MSELQDVHEARPRARQQQQQEEERHPAAGDAAEVGSDEEGAGAAGAQPPQQPRQPRQESPEYHGIPPYQPKGANRRATRRWTSAETQEFARLVGGPVRACRHC